MSPEIRIRRTQLDVVIAGIDAEIADLQKVRARLLSVKLGLAKSQPKRQRGSHESSGPRTAGA